MSRKKHDAVFDDVLSGLDAPSPAPGKPPQKAGSRFLKRSTAIGERLAGEREEKVLHWVDPGQCRMWARHNRDYALLTEDNCRDLIDGIRAQGQQEFPAIVRRLSGEDQDYEVICGARRHFAVSWLRAHNYTQFRYLVEVRDLTDEEAFRLADIENRDRDDISDFERARDYSEAISLYYGGKQKAMAARLEVSEAWLSRYLGLAKLPEEVVAAFPSIRDIRELHARRLKPLLAGGDSRTAVLREARRISKAQAHAREAGRDPIEATQVVARLLAAAKGPKPAPEIRDYDGLTARRGAKKTVLDIPDDMGREALEAALKRFVADRFDQG